MAGRPVVNGPGPPATVDGGYRGLSLWLDRLVADGLDDLSPRPALEGDADVDVAVVGAGFTGLWTAYYLLRADPMLRVLVLEAQIAGYGASGRNGGWCSALFPQSTERLVRRHGLEAALALRAAMNDTVDEVGNLAREEGLDIHYRKGGTLYLARTPVQLRRAQASVDADGALGGPDGLTFLSAPQVRERVGAVGVLGAAYTPHCARIQPARLVRGLARVVERRGGRIAERTRVLRVLPGEGPRRPQVVTDHGRVSARFVVRATEAWTAHLPGSSRDLVPVYSLMVATQPLPATFWDAVGLARGETFNDQRHLIIYGQRTADDRLAFGGRGAPYHHRSGIEPGFDRDESVFADLRETLCGLFPALTGHAFTHGWGGPLGVARDWYASVGLDRVSGLAQAGGYVGDGVGTSNLAGRTLCDLVLGRRSELTALPWVGHRSRRWEPEPLRWLGVNAGLRAMTLADREERLTGRPSVVGRLMAPLVGGH